MRYEEMTPAQRELVKTNHRAAHLTEPTVRTLPGGQNVFQQPNQVVTIAPILTHNPRSGCIVVDVFFDSQDTPKLRASIYLGTNQSADYRVQDPDSCWLVDLPEGIFTDKNAIRAAIQTFVDKGGGKPPGPPDW